MNEGYFSPSSLNDSFDAVKDFVKRKSEPLDKEKSVTISHEVAHAFWYYLTKFFPTESMEFRELGEYLPRFQDDYSFGNRISIPIKDIFRFYLVMIEGRRIEQGDDSVFIITGK